MMLSLNQASLAVISVKFGKPSTMKEKEPRFSTMPMLTQNDSLLVPP